MAYLCFSRATMAHVHAGGTTMALRHWTGVTAGQCHDGALPRRSCHGGARIRRRHHGGTLPVSRRVKGERGWAWAAGGPSAGGRGGPWADAGE